MVRVMGLLPNYGELMVQAIDAYKRHVRMNESAQAKESLQSMSISQPRMVGHFNALLEHHVAD
jgi:hypothetical protein